MTLKAPQDGQLDVSCPNCWWHGRIEDARLNDHQEYRCPDCHTPVEPGDQEIPHVVKPVRN